MRNVTSGIVAAAMSLSLLGCVEQPLGPTVPVMPGRDKSMAAFDEDRYYCEDYARDRVAGRVDAANDRIAKRTVIGALLGAALGAAVGNPRGTGAVIGGSAGAAIGATTAHPERGQYGAQREYDLAYAQCMDYRGDEVPPPYGPPPDYYRNRDRDHDYRQAPPPDRDYRNNDDDDDD